MSGVKEVLACAQLCFPVVLLTSLGANAQVCLLHQVLPFHLQVNTVLYPSDLLHISGKHMSVLLSNIVPTCSLPMAVAHYS